MSDHDERIMNRTAQGMRASLQEANEAINILRRSGDPIVEIPIEMILELHSVTSDIVGVVEEIERERDEAQAEVERLKEEVVHRRGDVDLLHSRCEQVTEAAAASHKSSLNFQQGLQDENTRLSAALRKHGRHLNNCAYVEEGDYCSCGWDDERHALEGK